MAKAQEIRFIDEFILKSDNWVSTNSEIIE